MEEGVDKSTDEEPDYNEFLLALIKWNISKSKWGACMGTTSQKIIRLVTCWVDGKFLNKLKLSNDLTWPKWVWYVFFIGW